MVSLQANTPTDSLAEFFILLFFFFFICFIEWWQIAPPVDGNLPITIAWRAALLLLEHKKECICGYALICIIFNETYMNSQNVS